MLAETLSYGVNNMHVKRIWYSMCYYECFYCFYCCQRVSCARSSLILRVYAGGGVFFTRVTHTVCSSAQCTRYYFSLLINMFLFATERSFVLASKTLRARWLSISLNTIIL